MNVAVTPDVAEAVVSGGYWLGGATMMLTLGLTVGLHYEGMSSLSRSLPGWKVAPRPRLLLLIFCLIGLHTIEIWLFAGGIFWLAQLLELQAVHPPLPLKLLDAVYLSAMTYTTVGYGDIVPQGPLRLVMASEALTGLLLITWSASFTYLEMEQYWRPQRGRWR
ncbi:MAG TPA: potassium channel family protein [Solimonas sp.]|nr:potassium channel family protein [Solimonas sp.]